MAQESSSSSSVAQRHQKVGFPCLCSLPFVKSFTAQVTDHPTKYTLRFSARPTSLSPTRIISSSPSFELELRQKREVYSLKPCSSKFSPPVRSHSYLQVNDPTFLHWEVGDLKALSFQ